MKRPGRVLVLDDHKIWRDLLRDTLREAGFVADCAESKEAALKLIAENFYHLLVVDINLDDTDVNNQDGWDLLVYLNEQGLSPGLKVIILSAYGTMDLVHEAFARHQIVDFVRKDKFLDDEFLAQVQILFESGININLDLRIVWDPEPKDLVVNLVIGGKRIKAATKEAELAAQELEDLLCRLFYRATQLLVNPLTPGGSGASVLRAQPVYARGGGHTVVVKFGDRQNVDQEYANFREYVAPYIGGGRSTSIPIEGLRSTTRLGGIVYNFLGTETANSFGNYYKQASADKIIAVIDGLFTGTCSWWYGNKGPTQVIDLTQDYKQLLRFTPERIASELEELKKHVQGGNRLKFASLGDRTFTNPLVDLHKQAFRRTTYLAITHGDFNETNILVDKDKHSWLIDFGRTGEGHILRDVAQLDSIVRLRLIEPDEATLEERLKLEEGLLLVDHFKKVRSEKFNFENDNERLEQFLKTDNAAIHKAFLVSLALRRIAGGYVPPPGEDVSEYYVALLYNAINFIRFRQAPSIQRLHGLLSASLLTDKLAQTPNLFTQVNSLYT